MFAVFGRKVAALPRFQMASPPVAGAESTRLASHWWREGRSRAASMASPIRDFRRFRTFLNRRRDVKRLPTWCQYEKTMGPVSSGIEEIFASVPDQANHHNRRV
ncbi:MAG: hypothetical protein ACI8PT_004516 [Gammaproteobacteria bacterium]|jgi:hypothetical protein